MKEQYRTFASKIREDLYQSLKLLSAAEGKPIQTLLEEAVTDYLAKRKFTKEELMVRENEARYAISFGVSKNKKKKPKK